MLVDHLIELALKAKARIKRGYYDRPNSMKHAHRSLVEAISQSERAAVITEIKYASPSAGKIRSLEAPLEISKAMLAGGACAISVLTDPDSFEGRLDTLRDLSQGVNVPVIMKDIVVSPVQLRAGAKAGADAVVFISEVFSKGLGEAGLKEMIAEAGQLGLETLVEVNGTSEFERLRQYKPELYGINNRDLSTFRLDLSTTEMILARTKNIDRPVVSESGIESTQDVRRLRKAGANAFLVGTSIMKSPDIEAKVRELVNA